MQGQRFVFGPFVLDPETGTLFRHGEPVPIGYRAFRLLTAFLERPGEVLTKSDLIDAAWQGAAVEEGNLSVQVASLRKLLGQLPEGSDWIATISRVGYRFVGPLDRRAVGVREDTRASPTTDLRGGPSIAVLPFVNLSDDPAQEYFADGMVGDIITDLSNVRGFFVIARNSTFAYKGKPTDVRQIARDLGVKYILEGSAQRSAQSLRINVQLVNAEDGGNHVWAERFDRDLSDIFAVQDEVTRRVVEAITGKLGAGPIVERYRPTNLEAYDLCVRSRNLWSQSKALNQEAYTFLIRAVALDPKYAEAHWQLALVQLFSWLQWSDEQEPHRSEALISAQRAVELDSNDSSARWVLGYVLHHERRWDEATAHFEASLRMNPNDADAFAIIADFKYMIGKSKEGLESIAMALRLNPNPPGWYYWVLGIVQVGIGQYDEAVATLRREETYRTTSRRILAAALALSGRVEEAREEARFFISSNPFFRISKSMEKQPFKDPKDAQFWFDALNLAGFPE